MKVRTSHPHFSRPANEFPATKLIRKHPNPEVRNVLIIAMTASAIQGDREKCLDSGMNNYLAKPVRAQTLKALLESYLNKDERPKEIPNLQTEAKKLVKEALSEAGADQPLNVAKNEVDGIGDNKREGQKLERPKSVRVSTTVRWHDGTPEEEPRKEKELKDGV
jgi:response regulator RpfG family c-di-GMP phosphodiesterase